MEDVRPRLPICLQFIAVKYCICMYLFVPLRSVDLKDRVMLTDKIRHSKPRSSHSWELMGEEFRLSTFARVETWNLTVAACGAYKHRLKSVVS